MTQPEKLLYTAKTHTTGGRGGASRSSDGRLDVKLSRPGNAKAIGGSNCSAGGTGLAEQASLVAGTRYLLYRNRRLLGRSRYP